MDNFLIATLSELRGCPDGEPNCQQPLHAEAPTNVEKTFMNLGVLLAHCGRSTKTTGGTKLVRHGRKIAALLEIGHQAGSVPRSHTT